MAQRRGPPDPSHFGTTNLDAADLAGAQRGERRQCKNAIKESVELPNPTPPVEQVRAAAQPTVDPFEAVGRGRGGGVGRCAVGRRSTSRRRSAGRAALAATDEQRRRPVVRGSRTKRLRTLRRSTSWRRWCKSASRAWNAGRDAELAVSLRSLAAWACNRSGEIESDSRRDDRALKAFELAIQWDPNCWLALHNRAVSRAQQGDLSGHSPISIARWS